MRAQRRDRARRPGSRGVTVAIGVAVSALLYPAPASAHPVQGPPDLPLPQWLFAWSAALVLVVSFVALMAWRKPHFERSSWRALPDRVSRLLVNGVTEVLAGLIGVVLLVVVIWSGLDGTQYSDRNFSVTFVFVTVWLGMAAASVLFGDLFRAFNPWRAIARVATAGFQLLSGRAPRPLTSYPDRIGRWPAVAGLVGFFWIELIYGQSGLQAGLLVQPSTVAIATLVYSIWTFAGMSLFGIEKWLARGETFSVYFNMLSRLSPFDVQERKLGIRRPLSGLTSWVDSPGSVAIVLVAIGGTAFDGAQEGALSQPIYAVFEWVRDTGIGPVASLRFTNTIFLAITLAGIATLFWTGVAAGARTVRTVLSSRRLGRAFAHTFVPISLAYLVAHYFSLFVVREQAQFTFLLSDPFGNGSDYFRTAQGSVDYGLIDATTVWYVQAGALVVGHVAALVLGHDRALTVYGDVRAAARSQNWMLALMVGFTVLGLYLLSQSNQ